MRRPMSIYHTNHIPFPCSRYLIFSDSAHDAPIQHTTINRTLPNDIINSFSDVRLRHVPPIPRVHRRVLSLGALARPHLTTHVSRSATGKIAQYIIVIVKISHAALSQRFFILSPPPLYTLAPSLANVPPPQQKTQAAGRGRATSRRGSWRCTSRRTCPCYSS
jgi:hypothetical protein